MDELLIATVNDDVINLNGVDFDFSPLKEGESIPFDAINSAWFASDVVRKDGIIHLTLILPHGANAPYETRFPEAYNISLDVSQGIVPLPSYDLEVLEDE